MYRSPRPPSELAPDAAEIRDPAFREALAAGVALVMHADGAASAAERERLLSLLTEDPVLAGVDRASLEGGLAAQDANFRFDPEVGALMAREALERVAGRIRLGTALARICRDLIPADGSIHPAEHRALAEIRSALGVTARPAAFAFRGARAAGTRTAAG